MGQQNKANYLQTYDLEWKRENYDVWKLVMQGSLAQR